MDRELTFTILAIWDWDFGKFAEAESVLLPCVVLSNRAPINAL